MKNHEDMNYDIVIVGAGPAGSTFAREIGNRGLKAAIIDGQSVSPNKPCGGLLAPDAQKLMAGYDLVLPKEVLADPQIFSVRTIDLEKNIERFYQRYYLNMDRHQFDAYLLSLVPEEVERINGRVMKITKMKESHQRRESDDGRFKFDVITEGGKAVTLTSKYVVGADGAASAVRKLFYKIPILRYVAIQQWFKIDMPPKTYYSCIFDEKTSESCSWTIHKNGYFIYGGCFKPKGCRQAFETQKKRLSAYLNYDFGEPIMTEACLACRPRRMKDFVTGKDGAWLIGEAAGFISASSLEGISFAIKSGSMLADAFNRGKGSREITSIYKKKALSLKLKLLTKVIKHKVIFTPWIRKIIMKSGIQSIK